MKLQNLTVIFIIIIIPIILVVSYYMSLQIDTINMQTSYKTKQLEATKEAIEAFEINTVEWNDAYSETADSKRRDVMASINTFTTNFANSLGIGGTSKENILTYIPAIACTLYDGYYIYSPAEVKSVIKDENGVAVFMTEDLAEDRKAGKLSGYTYKDEDEGKLLYECKSSSTKYNGTPFTLNPEDAETTYSHILKPFTSYSARYKNSTTDIVVNYTLDNYITIYGTVNGEYVNKSGYLIKYDNLKGQSPEKLTESIWYEGLSKPTSYTYVYAEDNTKVYFDGDQTFTVNSNGIRTNLEDRTQVFYKKYSQGNGQYIYQALCDKTLDNGKEIQKGSWYTDKNGTNISSPVRINIDQDLSAFNYYRESGEFSKWVDKDLGNITIGDMQGVDDISLYGDSKDSIFKIDSKNDPESEDSIFAQHKREVIKQSLISNLNQAITSYSRNSEGNYELPVLTETDWDQILRNVSIVTFVQNIPIGMKYYNNYALATSTSNKEYVNPDGIYLSSSNDKDYYHMPYCYKLDDSGALIGYRNIDYTVKSYKDGDTTKYYYKHENLARQACYYCLVQRDLYNEDESSIKENAYKTALARERYVTHEFR